MKFLMSGEATSGNESRKLKIGPRTHDLLLACREVDAVPRRASAFRSPSQGSHFAMSSILVRALLVIASLFAALSLAAHSAPQFLTTYGSTGADGALVVGSGQTRIINLGTEGTYDPVNWVVRFDYTNVSIGASAQVRFVNHPTRAPVAWIVQGDVSIQGNAQIQLNGGAGVTDNGSLTNLYSEPGPGGARGGRSNNRYVNTLWSAGFGPGGALGDAVDTGFGGAGGTYWSSGAVGAGRVGTTHLGSAYGGSAIFQLIGGSGGSSGRAITLTGSGFAGGGGGAGGGALLIAADGVIACSGQFYCEGGAGGGGNSQWLCGGGGGAGGAIRLASLSQVTLNSGSYLTVGGGGGGAGTQVFNGGTGGAGRIRIECPRAQPVLGGTLNPIGAVSIGEPQPAFRVNTPQLRIASIHGVPTPADSSLTAKLGPLGGGNADMSLVEPGLVDIIVESENVPIGSLVYLRITRATGHANVLGPLTLTAGTSVTFTGVDLTRGYSALQARAVLP